MNFVALKIKEEEKSIDLALLKHMEQAGLEFLTVRYAEKVANHEYRMGFHPPGKNSKHHLHLHLIVLPFKGTGSKMRGRESYGYGS